MQLFNNGMISCNNEWTSPHLVAEYNTLPSKMGLSIHISRKGFTRRKKFINSVDLAHTVTYKYWPLVIQIIL